MELKNLAFSIRVAARSSPLSQAQVQEVLKEIQVHYPEVEFEPLFLDSQGDKDHSVSLRKMEKTNFFTQEIDLALLNYESRIAIHSAKDLPEPIPEGLMLIALTKGVNSADALVLRNHCRFEELPKGALIATSSERREDVIKELREDLNFRDLRGTIHQRLKLLDTGEADGVVVAEAALIRLGLTQLNRVLLPGKTTPLQGKLAILARQEDHEMKDLFSCIHSL